MNYIINPIPEEKKIVTWENWYALFSKYACPGIYDYFFQLLPHNSHKLHQRCVICRDVAISPMPPYRFSIEWLKTLPIERLIPITHEFIEPNILSLSEREGDCYV